jgi:hypothetical protein
MMTTGNINPIFHYVFRDKEGKPATNGTVETFKSVSPVTQKPTYQDRALTIVLPNPIPLNQAGVASDVSGTPIPVYLEQDEEYYMVVKDSVGTIVQTIDNWQADNYYETAPPTEETVFNNYIPNAQFRELINDISTYDDSKLISGTAVPIAREGWYFIRNTANSQNDIKFLNFALGQTEVPYNPKHYLRFECTATGVETEKDIYVDIGDVLTFANQQVSFAFYARSSTSSTISLLTNQYFGSGGSPSGTITTSIDTFTLSPGWNKFTATFTVPDITGKTLGTNKDDKLQIRLRMPLNQLAIIDFTNNQLNHGDTVLEFDYKTSLKEKEDANSYQLPSPTTNDAGKVMTLGADTHTVTWEAATPIGGMMPWPGIAGVPANWALCDGQTLNGEENEIYHDLYLQIKNKYGWGIDGFPNFTNNALVTNFVYKNDTNVTDAADFNTGFTFAKIHDGQNYGFLTNLYSAKQLATLRVTNKNNGNVTDATAGTSGFTINIIQQGTGSLPEITNITPLVASGLAGKYFEISSTTTDYYVWFTVDGIGTDPAIGGRTGIKIALTGNMSRYAVAAWIFWALAGCEHQTITCVAASALNPSDYFLLYNSAETFTVYARINGIGSNVTSNSGLPFDISGSDTATQVATAVGAAIAAAKFQTPNIKGLFIRGLDDGTGYDPEWNTRLIAGDFLTQGGIGSIQFDEVGPHVHPTIPELGPTNTPGVYNNYWAGPDPEGTSDTLENSGLETRGVNIALPWIIRYK